MTESEEIPLHSFVRTIISDAVEIVGKALEELPLEDRMIELDAVIKSCHDYRQQIKDEIELSRTTPEDRRLNRGP